MKAPVRKTGIVGSNPTVCFVGTARGGGWLRRESRRGENGNRGGLKIRSDGDIHMRVRIPPPASKILRGVGQAVKPLVFQARNRGFESRTPYLIQYGRGSSTAERPTVARVTGVRLPSSPPNLKFDMRVRSLVRQEHSVVNRGGAGSTPVGPATF